MQKFKTENIVAKNKQRADHQRDLSATLQDVRERLTSTTGTRRSFDRQSLRDFSQIRVGASLALAGLTLMMAAFSLPFADPNHLYIWLATMAVPQIVSNRLCARFLRLDEAAIDTGRWASIFVMTSGVEGLVWAGLVFLCGNGGSTVEVYQFAIMLLVIAVTTLLSWNIIGAVVAATVPIVAITVGFFVWKQSPAFMPLAFTALAAEVFFVILCHRLFRANTANMEFRAEKDVLIAELEQANAVANESVRAADLANLAKSKFLATMSHELRTPLNAILGFSEIMKTQAMGPIENSQYREYVADIHDSGQHLLNLINEILDLSRIEAGRYVISEEAISLTEIGLDSRNLMRLRAAEKDITVFELFEPNLPKLWADKRAVRQMALNLISNAIKFTPNGGQIAVKIGWTADGGQYFSVRDTGPGIAEEEIPVVLSAFGQGASAITTAEAGTGLGLPIVQALIKMHDGAFDLKSRLREGTEATLIFPPHRVMDLEYADTHAVG